jgi:UDP-N-acetylmuramate--alanine ligase
MTILAPNAPITLPSPPAKVHFVGIGGIGMSGLARILAAWGYGVSGSDAHRSELTDALTAEGIAVAIGHDSVAWSTGASLVVRTSAVSDHNSEVAASLASGVPVLRRAQLLGLLANAKRCVAVAGSHGKSTTSGMLVSALRALGADPSYAVGAVVQATGTNAAPGAGPDMVVEADEYDYSFLELTPDVAVITNIDYDHPDLFSDQERYDAAFARFASQVRPGGTLVVASDDTGCRRLLERPDLDLVGRIVTFGEDDGSDVRLLCEEGGYRIATGRELPVDLDLQVPGRHNARNAAAAVAALVVLGQEPARAVGALAGYAGVGRRFELRGEAGGVTVVDDYAHHPAEIVATLRAARERYPGRRIVAAFQPHTYSRTKALLAEFAASLQVADEVAVLDIYPSRETDSLGISVADLIRLIPGAHAAGPAITAATPIAALTRPGDVVLTIGAGDVTGVGPRLLELLAAHEARE